MVRYVSNFKVLTHTRILKKGLVYIYYTYFTICAYYAYCTSNFYQNVIIHIMSSDKTTNHKADMVTRELSNHMKGEINKIIQPRINSDL